MTYRYRYVGDGEEVFPLLPVTDGSVTRVMGRGDVVECREAVVHAHLELIEGAEVPVVPVVESVVESPVEDAPTP